MLVEVEQDFEGARCQRLRMPTGVISKEVWSFLISLFDGPIKVLLVCCISGQRRNLSLIIAHAIFVVWRFVHHDVNFSAAAVVVYPLSNLLTVDLALM